MKTTMLSKTMLRALRGEINVALEDVAGRYGVTIRAENCSFNAARATFKLEVAVGDEAALEDEARREWERFVYRRFDTSLKPEHFGAEFTYKGVGHRIVGVKPKSRKYPVLTEADNGKRYKFPAHVVADALKREAA